MIDNLDRANCLKCKTNVIGGAHLEMGLLARVMGSTQTKWSKTIGKFVRIDLSNDKK